MFRRCYNNTRKDKNYILDLFSIIFRDFYIKHKEFQIFIVNKQ